VEDRDFDTTPLISLSGALHPLIDALLLATTSAASGLCMTLEVSLRWQREPVHPILLHFFLFSSATLWWWYLQLKKLLSALLEGEFSASSWDFFCFVSAIGSLGSQSLRKEKNTGREMNVGVMGFLFFLMGGSAKVLLYALGRSNGFTFKNQSNLIWQNTGLVSFYS